MSPVALVGSLDGGGTFTLEGGRLARLDPAAFDAVIRAVDQGLPIDANRVRDRVETALANNGGLAVATAEGAIVINAGQARLGRTAVRAQNADLAVNGSVGLTSATLDARLILSGMPGPGAPANTRPEIFITLKGSPEAPKRSIDAGAFASWLALRAVEQQSKKLDVLEGRGEVPASSVGAAAAARAQPVPAQSTHAREAAVPAAVDAKVDDPKETGAADVRAPDIVAPLPPKPSAAPSPAPNQTLSAPPELPRPRPAGAPPVHRPKPAAEVMPLPPPLEIRPAPTPRAQRPQPAPGATRPPPRPLTPPAPRSLSEILFGN